MRNDTKPLNINDNNDVIKALKESDEYAFENVYRYYFRGLCAFCSQYVPLSEAEEIVKVPPRADRCIYIKRFLSVIRRKNSLIDKALYIVVPDTVLVGKG